MNTNTVTKSVEDYLKEPYARVLIPEEDGRFSTEILEFPGCFSQGDTAEEAIRNLEEAAKSWIEATLEQGKQIPEPTANYGYGGKVALRLPRGLHRKATQMAEREGVSLNTFLVDAVAARIGAQNFYDRMAERIENRLIIKTAANVMARVSPLFQAWDKDSFIGVSQKAATQAGVPIVYNNVRLQQRNSGGE